MKVPINELIPLIEECAANNGAYFSPTGISMLPTIKNGDKVFLIKRSLKKNDIVFYRKNGAATMHRAIKINSDFFIARGDNQFWTENVKFEDIIAVVDHYFHNGKRIDCDSFIFKFNTFFLPVTRVLRRILRKFGLLNIA